MSARDLRAQPRPCRRAWNISSDTRSGASARIGGLHSCQPSAPGVGTNCGPMRKRVRLVVAPPAGEARAIGCARGVRARSSRRPRPARSSGICSCTTRRNRRRCRAAAAAGCRRHARGRNRRCSPARAPSRAISLRSKAWPVRYCTPGRSTSAMRWPCSASARSIACHRDRAVGLVGLELDQGGRRVEAVEADLRLDRVAVGRERAGLDQDRGALGGRPVEADHHQMQVGGQRIHRHDFGRLRADEARQRFAHELVVRHPRVRRGNAPRPPARPVVELPRPARARPRGCRPSELPQK